jgi:hypothetical protein
MPAGAPVLLLLNTKETVPFTGRIKTSAYHLQPTASESTILQKKEGPLPASGLSSPLHPLFLVLTAWLDHTLVAGQSPLASQGSF